MRQQEVQKVHPGLSCFREGVRGIPVDSIPGIRETGWRPVARTTRVARVPEECSDPDTLLTTLKNVLTTVSLNLILENVLKWRTDSDTNLTVVCRHRRSR